MRFYLSELEVLQPFYHELYLVEGSCMSSTYTDVLMANIRLIYHSCLIPWKWKTNPIFLKDSPGTRNLITRAIQTLERYCSSYETTFSCLNRKAQLPDIGSLVTKYKV